MKRVSQAVLAVVVLISACGLCFWLSTMRRGRTSEQMYASHLRAVNCKAVLESSLDSPLCQEHCAALRWFDKNVLKPGVPADEVKGLLSRAHAKYQAHENGSPVPHIVVYVFPTTPRMPAPPPGNYDSYEVTVNTKTGKVIHGRDMRKEW